MKTPKINKILLKKRNHPNYEIVRELVYHVHKEFCEHKLPIDLSFMYKFKNLRIKTYSWFAKLHNISIEKAIELLNSDSGCCYYMLDNKQYLILYNDLIENECHNRWTLAHELGHYLLKHNEICKTAILGRNSIDASEYRIYEKEANAFARELLAPLNVICCIFDRVTFSEVMEICDLSYKAASNIIDFANIGLEMGISYFSESKTTEIFKDFINSYKNLKSCIKCNYNLVDTNANYCPICGSNIFVKGETKNNMKYICNYNIDENSRLTQCPICNNEEIIDGEYCKICGTYLVNKCTNYIEDEWGNQLSGCGRLVDANARYCIHCGCETTFYKNKLLCDYKDYKEPTSEIYQSLWIDNINKLKQNGKIMLYSNLMNTQLLEINSDTVGINFPNGLSDFSKAIIQKDTNMQEIKEIVFNIFHCKKDIELYENNKESLDILSQSKSSNVSIPIKVIDDD
ncbi:MAG: ImmA/IrrE family metallo-endopeptidase [Clostridia bacterium]|nr:ImmA/IrrE family metallo-endopeptidase [Clostridia bacterium]